MPASSAAKIVIHAAGADAKLALALDRADITKVQIAGVDLVLTLADGTQHVLQGGALHALTDPAFALQFADGSSVSAASLLASAGPVNISDAMMRTVEKNTTENSAAPQAAPESVHDEAPPPRPAAADSGMVSGEGGGKGDGAAQFKDESHPLLLVVQQTSSNSHSAPAAGNPVPPEVPPAKTFTLATTVHNVTGQESSGGSAGALLSSCLPSRRARRSGLTATSCRPVSSVRRARSSR